ncbi:MAG: SDR family oxidoreductase, partial [Solirubrobacteraceae bacterium]
IDAALAERTAQELGSGTVGLPLDVTNRTSFATFLDEVENRLGPLDVLINNAGIMPIGPFAQETDATAIRMVDINLHGVIYGSKLALERFIPRNRGHLVNIASIAGKGGAANGATYCATKHAVVGLSEALRAELTGTGVEVSVVMPIGVNTELYSGVPQMRGLKTPEPEDVADAIVAALQTGRFEVYVPKRMGTMVRIGALMPRRAMDAFERMLGTNQTLTHPDHQARAANESRMAETIARAQTPAVPASPGPVAGLDAEAEVKTEAA